MSCQSPPWPCLHQPIYPPSPLHSSRLWAQGPCPRAETQSSPALAMKRALFSCSLQGPSSSRGLTQRCQRLCRGAALGGDAQACAEAWDMPLLGQLCVEEGLLSCCLPHGKGAAVWTPGAGGPQHHRSTHQERLRRHPLCQDLAWEQRKGAREPSKGWHWG